MKLSTRAFFVALLCTALLFSGCSSSSSEEAEGADSIPEPSASQGEPFPAPDVKEALAKAKAENPDVVGWLIVPGTSINEPVVQADDNSFYLRRNYKGNYAYSGSLFLDFRTFLDPPSQNTVIYGHNLGSPMGRKDDPEGEKFAQLLKFADIEFAKQNPYLYFVTERESYVYRIFCVAYTEAYLRPVEYHHDKYNAKEFELLTADLMARSLYRYNVPVGPGDTLLTLSTCTYRYGTYNQNADQRYIVVGRLVREGEYYDEVLDLVPNDKIKEPDFTKR